MVPIANPQADQMQTLGQFHGYPLNGFYEPLSRITKPLDR